MKTAGRWNAFGIILFLFLSGCGAALTGVGVVFLGQSSSSSSTINNVPVAQITSPSAGIEKNDLISLTYKILDSESNTVNIQVEWSTNLTTWHPATELPGATIDTQSDGVLNLASSPTGKDHTFVWNSIQDIKATDLRNTTVRIIPTDASTAISGTSATVKFDVMNTYGSTAMGRLQAGQDHLPYQPLYLWLDNVNQDKLYITNAATNAVTSLDLNTGVTKKIIGTGLTPFNGDNILGTMANLNQPALMDLGKDPISGALSIYIADPLNERIRSYNLSTGFLTTVVGNGAEGYDELFSAGDFNVPTDLRMDSPFGIHTVYSPTNPPNLLGVCFSEQENFTVRFLNLSTSLVRFYTGINQFGQSIEVRIDPSEARTIAGNAFQDPVSRNGGIWIQDTTFSTAGTFSTPNTARLVFTSNTRIPILYVADENKIRVVNLGTTSTTFYPNPPPLKPSLTLPAGEMGTIVNAIGAGGTGLSDGIYARELAMPNKVEDFFLIANGDTFDIYFSEINQNSVWKISGDKGVVSRVVGNGGFGGGNNVGDGGNAKSAQLAIPRGMAIGPKALFISEQFSNRIRAVNFTTQTQIIAGKTIGSGNIETVLKGPNSLPTDLVTPSEIVVDSSTQDLYIADSQANRILKFNFISRTGSVVAGKGGGISNGDGGNAVNANVGFPEGIALWGGGSTKLLFIGDNGSGSGNIKTGTVRIVNLGSTNYTFGNVSVTPGQINLLIGGGNINETTSTFSNDLDNELPQNVKLGRIWDVMVDTEETGKLPGVYILEEAFTGTGFFNRLLVYNPNSTDFQFTVNTSGGLISRTVSGGRVSAIAIRKGNSSTIATPLEMDGFQEPGRSSTEGGARSTQAGTSLVVYIPLSIKNAVIGLNYTNGDKTRLNQSILSGQGKVLAGSLNFGAAKNAGFNGDFRQATTALLNRPKGVLYVQSPTEIMAIADSLNNRLRLVFGTGSLPQGISAGDILTVAGNGQEGGYNGETLPATNTALSAPSHMASLPVVDVNGKSATILFVADANNRRIRIFAFTGN